MPQATSNPTAGNAADYVSLWDMRMIPDGEWKRCADDEQDRKYYLHMWHHCNCACVGDQIIVTWPSGGGFVMRRALDP